MAALTARPSPSHTRGPPPCAASFARRPKCAPKPWSCSQLPDDEGDNPPQQASATQDEHTNDRIPSAGHQGEQPRRVSLASASTRSAPGPQKSASAVPSPSDKRLSAPDAPPSRSRPGPLTRMSSPLPPSNGQLRPPRTSGPSRPRRAARQRRGRRQGCRGLRGRPARRLPRRHRSRRRRAYQREGQNADCHDGRPGGRTHPPVGSPGAGANRY